MWFAEGFSRTSVIGQICTGNEIVTNNGVLDGELTSSTNTGKTFVEFNRLCHGGGPRTRVVGPQLSNNVFLIGVIGGDGGLWQEEKEGRG